NDAALIALRDLAYIVFAAPNRLNHAGKDRLPSSLHAHLRRADDLAIGNTAAADDDLTPHLEELYHLGMAVHLLAIDRLQQALQGGLDVLDELVDDVIRPNIDAVDAGQPLRRRIDLDVEGDDDRVGRRCQIDIGLAHVADGILNQPHLEILFEMLLADT